ncbi:MAG: AbrB/MazE/SpoVT family DNA-binding domain-containing protein [Candidatus Margulisbacteria bacterium]|jgi:antitoxin MazE|nr:AbrB/MazE/SpoVT family DNA-binding domain-containing protein [Candidatus Margulisiibacteriota bacterium]
MEAVIQKWGNSLGLRLPSPLAKELDLRNGSYVEVEKNDRVLTIKLKPKYDLAEMLALADENNIPAELDAGVPVGKEIW